MRVRTLLLSLLLGACSTLPPLPPEEARQQVELALDSYSRMMLMMDSMGMAALYAPEGEIVHQGETPVRGPAAIGAFLASFKDYKVVQNSLVPDTTDIRGNRATQRGRYQQQVIVPGGKWIDVAGRFTAEWERGKDGRWRIVKMATESAP